MQKTQGEIEPALTPEKAKASKDEEAAPRRKDVPLDAQRRRMANDKLSEGIRKFYADARKLEKYRADAGYVRKWAPDAQFLRLHAHSGNRVTGAS